VQLAELRQISRLRCSGSLAALSLAMACSPGGWRTARRPLRRRPWNQFFAQRFLRQIHVELLLSGRRCADRPGAPTWAALALQPAIKAQLGGIPGSIHTTKPMRSPVQLPGFTSPQHLRQWDKAFDYTSRRSTGRGLIGIFASIIPARLILRQRLAITPFTQLEFIRARLLMLVKRLEQLVPGGGRRVALAVTGCFRWGPGRSGSRPQPRLTPPARLHLRLWFFFWTLSQASRGEALGPLWPGISHCLGVVLEGRRDAPCSSSETGKSVLAGPRIVFDGSLGIWKSLP